MNQARYKSIFSREQIAQRVKEMGGQVNEWCQRVWKDSHTDVIAIPVLRGGIFMFADLVREIQSSIEIAPARTWAYQADENEVQTAEVKVSLESVPAKGRHILIVDDICDTGRTLLTLYDALKKMGAIDIRSAVLIKRAPPPGTADVITPNYIGFHYPGKEWIVGYGMDDADRYRNLPYVGIIQR